MTSPRTYWPDNSIYFLTGTTFLHYPYFKEYSQKQIILGQIKKIKYQLGIPVIAYSIAINHYHTKFYLKNGLDLAKVKQLIHGGVSFKYKKIYKQKYKKIWQDSQAIIISSDNMDWKTTGYIVGNLLKHKEVNTFDELEATPFSSFSYFKNLHGNEESRQLVYSVIDIDESAEGEINMKDLIAAKAAKPSASSRGGQESRVERNKNFYPTLVEG